MKQLDTQAIITGSSHKKMKTKAAILYEIGKPLVVEDIELPKLNAGQVLVEVAYSGVCRSQLNEINGLRGVDKYLPHTLGHEGSGKVVEVGQGVTKVKSGDHVILSWIKGTGMEVSSTIYEGKKGRVHSGALSTFMHKTVTCENRVTPITDSMPLREAALLGCAVPTGAGIVFNVARIKPGESLGVFGVGGIGMNVILAAKCVGARTIIAVDLLDSKLNQAEKLGANHFINAAKKDVLSEILKITENRKLDYAIESAGSSKSMETAFESVREGGGLCILAGNLEYGKKISLDPFNLIQGKRIFGTWGGESVMDRDIPKYINLYLDKKFDLDSLIKNEYSLEKVNTAFEDLRAGEVGRAIIVCRQ